MKRYVTIGYLTKLNYRVSINPTRAHSMIRREYNQKARLSIRVVAGSFKTILRRAGAYVRAFIPIRLGAGNRLTVQSGVLFTPLAAIV